MQSRSKLLLYPRKGSLFRFQSTATSDGCEQKLENNVWHDSESIATKVCRQKGCKWNVVFMCIEYRIFAFQFKDFFHNLPLTIIVYSVTDQPPKIQFQRSVLNFTEVVKLLYEYWAQIVQSEKISFQSMSNAIIFVDERFVVKNYGISCLALIFNSSNPTMTILHAKNQLKVAICNESNTFLFCTLAAAVHRHCFMRATAQMLQMQLYNSAAQE